MENTKHLIVVSPMSETLQKLYEVLIEIADDEKINITEIEEGRELNRLISLGQSLIIFSIDKHCDLFLQENKSLITKFHSKVILFIPKEIPAKVLAKFLKAGLTEAIQEGSPPKTLLHKVKIHLRSIKAGNHESEAEDKDQVVKNNSIDLSKISEAMSDLSKHRAMASHDVSPEMNYLKKGEGAGTDKKGELKGNHSLKLDDISTSWNSKRRSNYSGFDTDNGLTSFKNKREKDIYYPLKKRIDTSLETISKDINKRKKLRETNTNHLSLNKITNIASALKSGKKARGVTGNSVESLDDGELPIESVDYGLGNKFNKKEIDQTEESYKKAEPDQWEAEVFDVKNKLSKMLDDLDAAENNTEESLANEEEEKKGETEENQEEQAGYRIEKKLPFRKDRSENSDEAEEEDKQADEEIKRNKSEKKLYPEADFEENTTEELPAESVENANKNQNGEKKLSETTQDSKKKPLSEESSADFDHEKKKYRDVADNDHESLKKDIDENGHNYKKESQDDIFIDMSGSQKEKKSNKGAGESDDLADSSNEDNLELGDKNTETRNEYSDDVNNDESSNNDNEDGLTNDKNANDKSNRAKGNNQDPSLTNDNNKKNPYSWGNLIDKNKSSSLDISKSNRPRVDLSFSYLGKNVSDQVINYHKIKKEFEKKTPIEEPIVEDPPPKEIIREVPLPEEVIPREIVETDVRGIEFCISIVKLIYKKDTEDIDYFKAISKELISQYKGQVDFYTYDLSRNVHLEIFNDSAVKANALDEYFTKTLPTWRCSEVENKTNKEEIWESTELPRWAISELIDKKVELIFPYFDGTDLMGTAVVFFPEGVDVSKEKSIMLTLETARTALLNTIQRKENIVVQNSQESSVWDKVKKAITFMQRFFSKKKKDDEDEA